MTDLSFAPTSQEFGTRTMQTTTHTNHIETTILLPAYNEAAALPHVLEGLLLVIDERTEILIVDDGSTDATFAIASEYPVRLIRHSYNQGKGAAVRSGLRAARGQNIIMMDADATYPADAIPHMIELLREHEFVRGIREVGDANMPWVNRLGNTVFDTVLRVVHGLEGGDHLTGLYGLRRDVFEAMEFTANGFDLEVEIGIKAQAQGLRSASFPFVYQDRLGEKKLQPFSDGWRILKRILNLALLYNPTLMFVVPGVLLWLMAVVLIAMRAETSSVSAASGFPDATTLLNVTLIGSVGFQFVIFGIAVGLYSIERGVVPRPWLLRLTRPSVRAAVVRVATVSVVVGLLTAGFWLVREVAMGGMVVGYRSLAAALLLTLWGIQAILAMSFISIFASRVEQTASRAESPTVFAVQRAESTGSD